ncbi:MAG: M61 family metallopeptidase [Proteobacteria bacterium]|nr:M61 family metallopeptidase [Pseudomonadota bacterium]MYJ97076.1 M61 family metallopeptidase [Pseudomonadota bacterium]
MIRYRVRLASLNRHHFEVSCRIANPARGQRFSLPSWTPGSYLLREYARHITAIRATSDGSRAPLEKVSKSSWQCDAAGSELTVTAEVFALDRSVRGAYLDTRRGYFNGVCLFLAPEGLEADPVEVVLERPEDPRATGWRVATAMQAVEVDADGFGRYRAENYDELIDHPFEIGDFADVDFQAGGVPHRLIIAGRHETDMDRVATDLARLCDAHIEFFGPPAPFRRYLFLGYAAGRGRGGLEHRASSSLMFSRDSLPVPGHYTVSESYRDFLSLCSHEYFHAWNVKRIKPAAFSPYRLDRRSHTRLLWVVEGVTSYYEDVLLLRSGLIDAAAYLRSLGKKLTRVYQTPGRLRQSLSEASFEAWDKYYKPEVNFLNANVNYYGKGALTALALDLTLRRESGETLDAVMRELWKRYGEADEGMPETAFEELVQAMSGLDLREFFESAVRGTQDLPLAELMTEFGVNMELRRDKRFGRVGSGVGKTAAPPLELGIRFRPHGAGLEVAVVMADGPAERAGVSPGDVLIAIDGLMLSEKNLLQRLARYKAGQTVRISGFRDEELLEFPVTLGEAAQETCVLSLADKPDADALSRRQAWLGC